MKLKARLDGDLILVETEFRHADAIKRVPGAKWHKAIDSWSVPKTWPTLLALTNELPIEGDDALKSWVASEYELEQRLHTLKTSDGSDLELLDPRLLPLQNVGAHYLREAGNVIMADEMGGGKTVMACVAMREMPDMNRILIICPNSIKKVWESHINEWCPGITPIIASDTKKKREEAVKEWQEHDGPAALIMNYESAWRHGRLAGYGSIALKKCVACGGLDETVRESSCEAHDKELSRQRFDLMICDEAHRMKDPKSKQTRGGWWFADNAEFVWDLTGTPIANGPDDLWSLLRMVDKLAWPSRVRYVERMCALSYNPHSQGMDVIGIKPEAMEEFQQAIARYFIRRTQGELIGQTIEKMHSTRYVKLSAKQKKIYNAIPNEIIVETESGRFVTDNNLTEQLRLRQVMSANLDIEEVDGEEVVRMIEPSSKLDELWRLWNDDMNGEPLVVMAGGPGARQLIELLRTRLNKKGVAYSCIVGGMSAEDADYEVAKFQNGQTNLFIGQTQVAGEGITLTRAKVICFIQRSWSLVENLQAEDRIRRYGQNNLSVQVIDILSADTVENKVIDIYTGKKEMLQEVVQDKKE